MPIATLPDASESASADAVRELVESDESRGLEFKRVSGKMVGKALETVCAFANTDGGVLVLGMADLKEHRGNARLFGVGENREAVDELQRKLVTEFQPPLEAVHFQRLHCAVHNGPDKGKDTLVVEGDICRP